MRERTWSLIDLPLSYSLCSPTPFFPLPHCPTEKKLLFVLQKEKRKNGKVVVGILLYFSVYYLHFMDYNISLTALHQRKNKPLSSSIPCKHSRLAWSFGQSLLQWWVSKEHTMLKKNVYVNVFARHCFLVEDSVTFIEDSMTCNAILWDLFFVVVQWENYSTFHVEVATVVQLKTSVLFMAEGLSLCPLEITSVIFEYFDRMLVDRHLHKYLFHTLF